MNSGVALEALAVAVSAGVPVLLWGSPGTGKTSAVLALGEALEWPVETVIGSIREPSDFAGLPVVIDGSVRLSPPAWATRLSASGVGLLFLDELTTAPPAVQAAMLRVRLLTAGSSRRRSPTGSSTSTGPSTESTSQRDWRSAFRGRCWPGWKIHRLPRRRWRRVRRSAPS
jgi:hypothetical protein